jgi:lipopolysaccharide biosynthesis glycosyltransferase
LDNQTSADAFNIQGDNKYTGALTTCLLSVLKNNKAAKSDVFVLLSALREELRLKRFNQVPKLCSTYNLARDKVFFAA